MMLAMDAGTASAAGGEGAAASAAANAAALPAAAAAAASSASPSPLRSLAAQKGHVAAAEEVLSRRVLALLRGELTLDREQVERTWREEQRQKQQHQQQDKLIAATAPSVGKAPSAAVPDAMDADCGTPRASTPPPPVRSLQAPNSGSGTSSAAARSQQAHAQAFINQLLPDTTSAPAAPSMPEGAVDATDAAVPANASLQSGFSIELHAAAAPAPSTPSPMRAAAGVTPGTGGRISPTLSSSAPSSLEYHHHHQQDLHSRLRESFLPLSGVQPLPRALGDLGRNASSSSAAMMMPPLSAPGGLVALLDSQQQQQHLSLGGLPRRTGSDMSASSGSGSLGLAALLPAVTPEPSSLLSSSSQRSAPRSAEKSVGAMSSSSASLSNSPALRPPGPILGLQQPSEQLHSLQPQQPSLQLDSLMSDASSQQQQQHHPYRSQHGIGVLHRAANGVDAPSSGPSQSSLPAGGPDGGEFPCSVDPGVDTAVEGAEEAEGDDANDSKQSMLSLELALAPESEQHSATNSPLQLRTSAVASQVDGSAGASASVDPNGGLTLPGAQMVPVLSSDAPVAVAVGPRPISNEAAPAKFSVGVGTLRPPPVFSSDSSSGGSGSHPHSHLSASEVEVDLLRPQAQTHSTLAAVAEGKADATATASALQTPPRRRTGAAPNSAVSPAAGPLPWPLSQPMPAASSARRTPNRLAALAASPTRTAADVAAAAVRSVSTASAAALLQLHHRDGAGSPMAVAASARSPAGEWKRKRAPVAASEPVEPAASAIPPVDEDGEPLAKQARVL